MGFFKKLTKNLIRGYLALSTAGLSELFQSRPFGKPLASPGEPAPPATQAEIDAKTQELEDKKRRRYFSTLLTEGEGINQGTTAQKSLLGGGTGAKALG